MSRSLRLGASALVFCVLFGSGTVQALGKKQTNPALPGEPPAAEPPAEHGEIRFRMMSYNIAGIQTAKDHTRYKDIGIYFRGLRNLGRAPHILAVQEAFVERTEEMIEEAGYPYVYYGPQRKGVRIGSGLVILSEYPIYDAGQEIYRLCGGVDCMARKGMLRVKIAVPGFPAPIHLFNTHLNADYPSYPPFTFEGDIVRVRQVTQLRDYYLRNFDPAAITMFFGDFNFKPTEYAYALFQRRLDMVNASEWCGQSGGCGGFDDPLSRWQRDIDHQFFVVGSLAKGPAGHDLSVTPEYFFREDLGASLGRPLSDHHTHEVHYRVVW
ncbi:MAG: endonuclease/exonuclease/phosphatase family protein [Bdellovibrionales bacterium]|nr:endonuclease/exonuclease/phosphatase family protein [Bdellovibrionales bacterium]